MEKAEFKTLAENNPRDAMLHLFDALNGLGDIVASFEHAVDVVPEALPA